MSRVRITGAVCLAVALSAQAGTTINFSLDSQYSTSAGVFTSRGQLIRTLWSGRPMSSGSHTVTWDDRDDEGNAVAEGSDVQVRLLRHRVSYQWDGVIGNTSAHFSGPGVHHSLYPPSSIAIAGSRAIYAVGYNEIDNGLRGFSLDQPQIEIDTLERPDPYVTWALVASDGKVAYWADGGGLSNTNFVMASDLQARKPQPLPMGQSVCLQPIGPVCRPGRSYAGVIDVNERKSQSPTGLAVQTHGNILAIAHATSGTIKLFDKTSGAFLRDISIPSQADASNQLATAPNGDLWVVEPHRVVRYTHLDSDPVIETVVNDLQHPLAVAVAPASDDLVLIADGGGSQQVKAYDRRGQALWTFGKPGGYGSDPRIGTDKLWFRFDGTAERTAMAVGPGGDFWIVDTCNDRMLHISAGHSYIEQIAYLPASYNATVDANMPARVFANYLEYSVPANKPLTPGPTASWSLVRNWLAGLPDVAAEPEARNGLFTGFQAVVTMRNQRTYALSSAHGKQVILELPASGAARLAATLPAPASGETSRVLYEDGDIGYAATSKDTQSIYRQALTGFDAAGDPQWEPAQNILAAIPTTADSPSYKGAFSGITGPRFPITSSSEVIFYDQSVAISDPLSVHGFHLGAVSLGGRQWEWRSSRAGSFEEPGAFPNKAVDPNINYGGNMVWAVGRHIVYGYHGEGFTDPMNGKVGQANRFMHFYDDGLFIGQFGTPTTRTKGEADIGAAGNAFSNILVAAPDAGRLLFFHNDEGQHGGVHRWTINNLASVHELLANGRCGGSMTLQ